MIRAEKTDAGVKINLVGIAEDLLDEVAVAMAHVMVNAVAGSRSIGDEITYEVPMKEIIIRAISYLKDIESSEDAS